MALFTDGSISGMEDLLAQDSQLLSVTTVEGIDVTAKMALAQEEIGLDLITMLNRLGLVDPPFWLAPQPRLHDVVVTKALRFWHTYRTLEMVYSDAYSSQLNDRYAAKRDQFHQAAHRACEKLMQIGLGMTSRPVPQAKTPVVIAIPGSLPDGLYYVTMAWLNSTGEEGAGGVPVSVTLAASTLQVQPLGAPAIAAGWNVYAGPAPETMFLQNESPIAPAELWRQPNFLIQTGPGPGPGQEPNYFKPIPRVLQRG